MNLVRDRVTTFASDRLVDLTGVTHVALREGFRNGDDALRNQVVRRESRRDIENALNFAYGMDPSGRRLPLVSDQLPIEQLRRAVIARDRHDPKVAGIYARADRFDDGQPNVRLLSHQELATPIRPASKRSVDNGRSKSSSSTLRSASVATPGSTRFATSASQRSKSSGKASARTASVDGKQNQSFGEGRIETVVGATALKLDHATNDSGRSTARATLSVVGRRRRSGGQIAVISFWTTFVVVMMFTAVVMWAQNTTGSVELEKVNKNLAEAEGTYTELRVEVARLQSPQRIEMEATRLGLSTPLNITFVDSQTSGTNASQR